MAGCGSGQYSLTTLSTEGGRVFCPGEGTFNYDYGTVVELIAEADVDNCYEFVSWTGDVGNIANVNNSTTTITMDGSYVITANFSPEVSENLEIWDWYDLDAVRDNRCGNHTLMNDLDCTTPGYAELASPTANEGKGWQPIGFFIFTDIRRECGEPPMVDGGLWFGLTGIFDGQGHEIRDLFINRRNEAGTGLFAYVNEGGIIKNVGVVNVTVIGDGPVGGLVGKNEGTVVNSYSTGNVTGGEVVYDLFGMVGGLVGGNGGTVSNSYSTVSVTGNSDVGGLVGDNDGTVNNSCASSTVVGTGDWVGGLLGTNGGTIGNSYCTGNVTGHEDVGGLVGWNHGPIDNSYSTGSVTGSGNVGGLVGGNADTVSNSFWDKETSGQTTSAGGTGKTTAEMQSIVTFSGAGWDIITVANPSMRNFSYIWNIVNGVTYPFLSWQP